MCGVCGCGGEVSGDRHEHAPRLFHRRAPSKPQHSHDHRLTPERMIVIERNLLSKNQELAELNREFLRRHRILCLNMVSSPGAGKTTLLVKTIERLKNVMDIAVIEGDQQTDVDARRIRTTGVKALQINTGKGCHLDAHMVSQAMEKLQLKPNSLLIIENVGNLVCPSSFDLGEHFRVVVLSVTEGEDKPLKYPDIFASSQLMILQKIDLLPHLEFNPDECEAHAKRIQPHIQVLRLSAKSGEGLEAWLNYIKEKQQEVGSPCV